MNDEVNRGQMITPEEDGRILFGKSAANALANEYGKEIDTFCTQRQVERKGRDIK